MADRSALLVLALRSAPPLFAVIAASCAARLPQRGDRSLGRGHRDLSPGRDAGAAGHPALYLRRLPARRERGAPATGWCADATHCSAGCAGGLAIVSLFGVRALYRVHRAPRASPSWRSAPLLYPALEQANYPESASASASSRLRAVWGCSSRPRLPLILYGVVAQQMNLGAAGQASTTSSLAGSVPRCADAGAAPPLQHVADAECRLTDRRPSRAARRGRHQARASWEIPLPFVVLGGIYSGGLRALRGGGGDGPLRAVVEVVIRREIPLGPSCPR